MCESVHRKGEEREKARCRDAERGIIGGKRCIERGECIVYNSGKQLLAKKGNMRLGEGREAMLQDIYEIHKVKDAAVIAVALGGGIPTAVTPGGEVLKPEKAVAEGVRVIGPLEE